MTELTNYGSQRRQLFLIQDILHLYGISHIDNRVHLKFLSDYTFLNCHIGRQLYCLTAVTLSGLSKISDAYGPSNQ